MLIKKPLDGIQLLTCQYYLTLKKCSYRSVYITKQYTIFTHLARLLLFLTTSVCVGMGVDCVVIFHSHEHNRDKEHNSMHVVLSYITIWSVCCVITSDPSVFLQATFQHRDDRYQTCRTSGRIPEKRPELDIWRPLLCIT